MQEVEGFEHKIMKIAKLKNIIFCTTDAREGHYQDKLRNLSKCKFDLEKRRKVR